MRGLLTLIALIAIGCGGGTPAAPAPGSLGSRETFVAEFEDRGFVFEDSPLNDGRQRWLGRRASDSIGVEAIGPADAITTVTLTAPAGEEAGSLAGLLLNTYAPESKPFFSEVMDDAAAGGDQDQRSSIAGRTVRVQTLAFGDGAIVTMTITADEASR